MQGMVVVGLIVEELSINVKFVKYRSRSLGTCQASAMR